MINKSQSLSHLVNSPLLKIVSCQWCTILRCHFKSLFGPWRLKRSYCKKQYITHNGLVLIRGFLIWMMMTISPNLADRRNATILVLFFLNLIRDKFGKHYLHTIWDIVRDYFWHFFKFDLSNALILKHFWHIIWWFSLREPCLDGIPIKIANKHAIHD